MLELRPSCEHFQTWLPPASTQARICIFECTFCASCAAHVLGNVCPNCGGDFVPDAALERGSRRLGVTGTRWLVCSDVCPQRLATHGLQWVRPDDNAIEQTSRIVMEELVQQRVRAHT